MNVLHVGHVVKAHDRVDLGVELRGLLLDLGVVEEAGVHEEVSVLNRVGGVHGVESHAEHVAGEEEVKDVGEEVVEDAGLLLIILEARHDRESARVDGLTALRERVGDKADVLACALLAVVVVHAGDGGERGVHGGEVVVLHEVVGQELPVGLAVVGLLAHADELVQRVVAEVEAGVAEDLVERRHLFLGGERGEDEGAPGGNADVEEAKVVLVEGLDVLGRVRRADAIELRARAAGEVLLLLRLALGLGVALGGLDGRNSLVVVLGDALHVGVGGLLCDGLLAARRLVLAGLLVEAHAALGGVPERRGEKAAVEGVAPAVIRAGDDRVATVLAHELGAAVAADVEEAIEVALLVAHDEDGLAADLAGDGVPGLAELVGHADADPRVAKDLLLLGLEEALRRVRVWVDGEGLVRGHGGRGVGARVGEIGGLEADRLGRAHGGGLEPGLGLGSRRLEELLLLLLELELLVLLVRSDLERLLLEVRGHRREALARREGALQRRGCAAARQASRC
mmetsp:Transcript_1498/g.4665  ORF Transcript_1498/g.4665 Transcript_1498/m.4665 type:complete len:512 (-) Transcript_1498:84-1619(-)